MHHEDSVNTAHQRGRVVSSTRRQRERERPIQQLAFFSYLFSAVLGSCVFQACVRVLDVSPQDVQILQGGLKYVNPLSGHLDWQLVLVVTRPGLQFERGVTCACLWVSLL